LIGSIPQDKQNYTLLLAELRRQLDALGEGYLLTIAAPAVPFYWNNMEIAEMHPYLDFMNIMAYDMYVGEVASHHAALYPSDQWDDEQHSIQTAVQAYLGFGVPADKLIGVPFYGHGRAKVGATYNGLFQPYTGRPAGTWGSGGLFSYADLLTHYLSPETTFRDETAQAVWYYDAATQTMISYDDPTTLQAKAAYIRENGLGGMMIWELGYDDETHSLLGAVYQAFQLP
jgi:chitinase